MLIPHPAWAPKIRKLYEIELQNDQFLLCIFTGSSGPNRGVGDFFFRVFPGSRCFRALYQLRRLANLENERPRWEESSRDHAVARIGAERQRQGCDPAGRLLPVFKKRVPWYQQKSYDSTLAFMILEPGNPPAISCGFLRCAPQKPHFSAGKCIFLQESAFFWNALFCRKMFFFCRKTHFFAVHSGGLRIMNGRLFLDEGHV